MTIEFTIIISIVGVLIALLTYSLNKNKAMKEAENDALKKEKETTTVLTTISIKLDNIGQNVAEIRLDNKEISKNVTDLSNRMSLVEKEINNHDDRLDKLEKK